MKIVPMLVMAMVASFAIAANKPTKLKWALAEGAPDTLQYVLDNQPKWREAEIKALQIRVAQLKAAAKGESRGSERKKIYAELSAIENRIKSIRADEIIVVSNIPPVHVGEAGNIRHLRVLNVIDEKTAVVEIRFGVSFMDAAGAFRKADETMSMLISGIDTEGWIDGQFVKGLGDVFAYAPGTNKDYGQTFLEIRPFTLDAFIRAPVEK